MTPPTNQWCAVTSPQHGFRVWSDPDAGDARLDDRLKMLSDHTNEQ